VIVVWYAFPEAIRIASATAIADANALVNGTGDSGELGCAATAIGALPFMVLVGPQLSHLSNSLGRLIFDAVEMDGAEPTIMRQAQTFAFLLSPPSPLPHLAAPTARAV